MNTVVWLPFHRPDMMEIHIDYQPVRDDEHRLRITCHQSHVGDVYRFCFIKQTSTVWVATPYHDDCVPVYPTFNDDDETRVQSIELVCHSKALADEAYHGILADLDEYIRSKKALETSKLTRIIMYNLT